MTGKNEKAKAASVKAFVAVTGYHNAPPAHLPDL